MIVYSPKQHALHILVTHEFCILYCMTRTQVVFSVYQCQLLDQLDARLILPIRV